MSTKTLRDELADLRARIADLQAERDELTSASLPRDEFRQRVDAWVDRSADRFREDLAFSLSTLRAPESKPRDPLTFMARGRAHPAFEGVTDVDLAGMMCFLLRDEIKGKVAESLDSYQYLEGLPLADRPAALERVAADLDALELREEALIARADAAGMAIARRADVRPEIVLHPDAAPETKA